MIITTTGYFGTGSSAITDLLSEFDCVVSTGQFEQRFLHDPLGISDLEFHVVENFNRHNSGYAVKRFEKYIDSLSKKYYGNGYYRIYGKNFQSMSKIYIDSLKALEYKGYWHQDLIDQGKIIWFISRVINKILTLTVFDSDRGYNALPFEKTYLVNEDKESFLLKTQKYTKDLFSSINPENKHLLIDQLVPPNNICRYLRYLQDCKVFLVDRDPRDLYVLNKYIWKTNVIPTKSVQEYCEWYKNVRIDREKVILNDNVMYIQFEDLVYNYFSTLTLIVNFLELRTKSQNNFTVFKPEESKKNTKLFHKFNSTEISFIEKSLSQYLYNFPNED